MIATIVRARARARARLRRARARASRGWQEHARSRSPPQGHRSRPAARSALRIVCLQFIGRVVGRIDERSRSSQSSSLPRPPLTQIALWRGAGRVLDADWGGIPRARGSRCVRSTNTGFHLTRARVASRTLTPRWIGTICLIGIIVSTGGDDRAAN